MNLTPFCQKHFPQIFKTQPTPTDDLRPEDKKKPPQGVTNLAFWLEDNVSVLADIILTLQQEVFRRGFKWTPRWVQKCAVCGAKYHEKKVVCDCGANAMIEPDSSQIMQFTREGGASFLAKANLNGTSLKFICRDAHRNLNISDRGYLLIIKKYLQDLTGNIISAAPVEILSVDPRTITEVRQKNGLPGGKHWTCLEHRDVLEQKPGTCPRCGKMLYDVLYETADKKYYVRDEVRQFNLYYLDGYPPILKIIDDAMSYHYLEKRTHNTYEKGRGPGIFMFPTNNPQSLSETWNEVNKRWEEDPDYVPAIGYDAGQGKGVAQFIKLLDDPNPDLIAVKKDIRERIMSFFEISPLFMADTSASGGLNNEGQQITVTNRGIEFNQSVWNGDPETFFADGVLAWVCDQFGITDFVLQLNPSEERDEMAEKERFSKDAQNAKLMLDMGFDVKFENNKFTFSGQAQKPQPPGIGAAGLPALPNSTAGAPGINTDVQSRMSGEPADVHKSDITYEEESAKINENKKKPEAQKPHKFVRAEWTYPNAHPRCLVCGAEEPTTGVCEGAVQKVDVESPDELSEYQGDQLIKSFAGDAITAIRRGTLYSFYSDVDAALVPKIHDIIKTQFLEHRLSLREMVEKMTALGIEEEKARMIARTESTGVAMKAREIGWKRMERERGEEFMYKAVITNDARTSPISRRIKAAVDAEGGAVPLARLKEIYREESTKPYIPGDPENSGMGYDWTGWENFVGHPWERDSIVRVVELSKMDKIEEQLAMQKLELYKKMAEKL